METDALLARLKKALGGRVLQTQRLGRGALSCVWVEPGKIAEIAAEVASAPGLRLDWLEDLSVIQVDDALVFSWLVRTSIPEQEGASVILRATEVIASPAALVEVPSVARTWPTAPLMEAELAALFGIRFTGAEESGVAPLHTEWKGFPLRKDYRFPDWFKGIQHGRAVGRSPGTEGSG